MNDVRRTPRTTIRRLPARGSYQRETINAILDEGLVCHAGFIAERRPVVIPMAYGRDGDRLFLHGSAASRAMRSLAAGIDLCVTVTLFDGLVLARSLFHHSMNYRSVVIFGEARLLEDRSEKLRALDVITEHIVPGRVAEARGPNELELKATSVLELPIIEASAKVRSGSPTDEKDDMQLPVWAGCIDFRLDPVAVHPDPALSAALAAPDLARFRR